MVAPPVKDIEKDDEILTDELEDETPELLQDTGIDIKHVIRGINTQNQFGEDRSEPVSVVEDYIKSFLLQGYRLILVQHLRSNMAVEGNTVQSEQMLYVLLRDA
jgi:hypothetical protein